MHLTTSFDVIFDGPIPPSEDNDENDSGTTEDEMDTSSTDVNDSPNETE